MPFFFVIPGSLLSHLYVCDHRLQVLYVARYESRSCDPSQVGAWNYFVWAEEPGCSRQI